MIKSLDAEIKPLGLEEAVLREMKKYNLDNLKYPTTIDDLKREIRSELLGVTLFVKPGKKSREAEKILKKAGINYSVCDLSKFKSYDPEFEPLPYAMAGYGAFHGLDNIRDCITLINQYGRIIRNGLKRVKIN